MKRLYLCLLLLCLLPLSSCHGQRYGILSYQENEIYAECILNGEYKIAITKKENEKAVSFLEPSSLSTVSFTESNGEVVGCAGEIEIPFAEGDIDGVLAILSMFSLDEETLVLATSVNEEACMEFLNTFGRYKVTLGKNDLPRHIEISSASYAFDIAIEAIRIN